MPSLPTALSPLSSPTHTSPTITTSSSPQVPARRKVSTPNHTPTDNITESAEYKEDVGRLLKKFQSTGTVAPGNTGTKQKPTPPPRLH